LTKFFKNGINASVLTPNPTLGERKTQMELDSDLMARVTAADLLAIYKAGPEVFFKVVEEEILRRMEKGGGLETTLKKDFGNISNPIPVIVPQKRKVSAKARKNMSRAQKERWANKRESRRTRKFFDSLKSK